MSFNVGGLRREQPFRIRRIGHFGYHTPDLSGTIDFLTNKLGLVLSDVDDFTSRVPELPKEHALGYFLRCGTDHHTIVVGSQMLVDTREPDRRGAVVGQVSWQVGSLQEVVDGVGFLDRNTRIRRVGRDAPGSNWHAYAYDPDGYIHEVFYGMEQIGWDGRSKPAAMYHRAFHECPELPQISEHQEVKEALRRDEAGGGYRPDDGVEATYDVDGILMARPFKLTRLARVSLFVADPERSLAFYRDVLGLTVTQRIGIKGHEGIFLRADNEHHSLAIYPSALQSELNCAAAIGFSVATYRQLKDARRFLEEQGVAILDLPAELSPGVRYGFWVKGPDQIAIQIFYGMDCVDRNGDAPNPATLPMPFDRWPDAIEHGGPAWFEPPFMGPLA